MKKHLHNSLRALFLSLAVLMSLPMLAEEINGINYDLNAETKQAAVIKKSSGEYSGDVVIPESVEFGVTAYSVTSIGTSAFVYCDGLTSVTIPNSVTSIGGSAFYDCDGLTSVTIPNSVVSIEGSAFANCKGLTSVTIGSSVESIGWSTFGNCSILSDVYCYAEEVPNTSSDAFVYSPASATLHVPAGSINSYRTTAPWSGFENIVALPPFSGEVEIDGINYELNGETKQATVIAKTSGEYSGSIVIPESVEYNGTTYSVTSIGDRAFEWCSGLTSVTIGNSVTSIGNMAFYSCSSLTSVTIGNSVTSIGDRAFWGCSGLASATIGNSVASIGNMAFYSCSSLTSVTIPNSVTSIEYQAFSGCSGLTSVTIPNSVTSIGINAFADCSGLTSVTIGNGVESIGQLAFSYCSQLHDVYCYAEEVPTTESNAFSSSPIGTATLHVPAGSVDSYKTAPWSGFANIVAIPNQYELSVSSAGYATLCLAYNAEIPQDVEVYVAEKVDGDCLKMKKVEGVLPAMTGVIVKANEGTYAFIQSEDTPAEIGENLLVGSVFNRMVGADKNTSYYILAAPDDNNNEVGMYRVELIDDKFECMANKAYLPFDSSAPARIRFDFGTETGILETENGNVKTENCYDLSGRRVQNAQKGIFIVNGKKVIK